jgi:surface antigen
MRMLFVGACLALAMAVLASSEASLAAQDKKDEPKYTIKEVMKQAQKGPLLKKVMSGEATDEEGKTLLAMYKSLAKQTPPKGEPDAWKKKTDTLIAAAQLYVDGKKADATAALTKSANACAACHKEFK